MADPIEQISIEIGASSETATEKIKGLANVLTELKTAAKGLTISNKFAENLNALSGALRSLSSDKIELLRHLGNSMRAIGDAGKVTISSSLADNIFDLAAAASEINYAQINNLNSLGEAIRTGLGSLDESFSEKIRGVGNALTYFTNIKTGSINQNLPARLGELGTVIRQFDDADIATLNSVTSALQGLAGGRVSISEKTPETLMKLLEAVHGVDDADISRLDKLTSSIERLKGVDLKGMSETIATVNSLGDMQTGATQKGILGSVNDIKRGVKGLNDSLMKATKLYKIVNSLGRVAFYRLIRSAIKAVTDALREGTENAYQFSKAFGDSTAGVSTIAQAYDNLASVSFKMSNQLGAAWASLIRAVEPIIIQLLNLITRLANAITQLFAMFSGSGTYLKAVDYNKNWADSAKGAAKAAKEWKNQLMGFDEINRLEEPSDGGGGGGGSASPDYSKMFEITPVSSAIADFVSMVKKHITELELFADSAILGIGLALLFSGANIPLGLALTSIGAYKLGKDVVENWDTIKEKIGIATSSFMAISGLSFGVGAALAFSGVNVPLGLALMAIGAMTMATAAALNWDDMPKNLRRVIGDINMLLGGSLLALGLVLTFATPQFSPIGLALIAAGVIGLTSGIAINWDYMVGNIGNTLHAITMIAGGAFLALGLLLTLTAANVPLGLGLVLAGIGTMVASANINWEAINQKLSGSIGKILMLAGTATLAIGMILAFSGVGIPIGLALMAAGIGMTVLGAANYDWDALPNKISEVCEKIKKIFHDLWETVKRIFDDNFGRFQEDVMSIVDGFKTNFQGIIDFISGVFTGDWHLAWQGITEIVGGALDAVMGMAGSFFDFIGGIIQACADAISWLRGLWSHIRAVGDRNVPDADLYATSPSFKAEGGFVGEGQLFVARESGPELVGSVGNRTAVANNDQIVEAVSAGVFNAVVSAFAQSGGGGSGQPVNIYMDGRLIAQSTTKYQKQFARASGV